MNYLVIGYGNTLRGDDGAGQRVAERVNDWNLINVRSLSLHQLTPEVAAAIAEAEVVFFVDAITPAEAPVTQVQITQLQAETTSSQWAHFQDPRSLLLLTQKLYSKTPIAYQIGIPAENFAFGESLSATTEAAVEQALAEIHKLICDLTHTIGNAFAL
jgi:hydrogenase maturation protease